MRKFLAVIAVAELSFGTAQASVYELVSADDGSTSYNGVFHSMSACNNAQSQRNVIAHRVAYKCIMQTESGSNFSGYRQEHYDSQHLPKDYDRYDNRLHGYRYKRGHYK